MKELGKYKRLFGQSIARKFIIYIFVFSAVITVILTVIQLYVEYRQGIDVIENNISVVEVSHLDSIINTLWISDMELLQKQLNGMFKLSDMQHISISDGGVILAEVGSVQNEHIISESFQLEYKYGPNVMSLGTLQVSFTLAGLYHRLFNDAVMIAITHAVKTLLVSFFILVIFYRLVGKHLVAMSDYAASLSFDQLSSPLSLGRRDENKTSPDELGTVVAAINQMRQNLIKDVSDRAQVEKELRQSKELLQFATEGASLGIWDWNLETNETYFNPIYFTMLGYDPDDLPHSYTTWSELVHPDDKEKAEEEIKQCLAEDRAWKTEFRLRCKNDEYKWIFGCGKVVEKDASGNPIRATGVHLDISEGKNLQEERQKVIKLESVGILAGGIAHDFNNILSAILGNIELASYRVNDDERTHSLLSDAQKATKRATKLTQQLLTFSKGGSPVREKTSLIGLIQESADFVLHGSHVSCDYTFPDDLWMVIADSGQIGQVVQNIILNAKHAMPEGGKIHICCSNVENASNESHLSTHEGLFVHITIQDTGIGISQKNIDKIFDPYFTTKQEGSGLGLAICHSIISKHDGYLSVQSIPEKGTTFFIDLPAVHSIDNTIDQQLQHKPATEAIKIMVMDDEEMIRNVARAQLKVLGHEVVLVADGERAINTYQELLDNDTPVDLVIMDLTIPGGMGGKEAARKLLLMDQNAKLIVASGYSNDPVMSEFKEYGFRAAIAKPFDLEGLSHAIASAM